MGKNSFFQIHLKSDPSKAPEQKWGLVLSGGGMSVYGISALVHSLTENPANHSSIAKAFPNIAEAANAIIALENYRKLQPVKLKHPPVHSHLLHMFFKKNRKLHTG